LLDLSSDVMSRASFSTLFTTSNSFWNTQNLYSTMSWLQQFLLQIFPFSHATFIK